MTTRRGFDWRGAAMLATALLAGSVLTQAAAPATPAPSAAARDAPYIVEWVYKVKWGHSDEFFDIFKKYQIRVLDREKELGNVLHYTVYRPGLHTSEDERWDYRVVIVYKNQLVPAQARQIEKQLFPDRAEFKREENHRWELIDAHWDLPIREIDPHASEE
jgi:hypothetical protein